MLRLVSKSPPPLEDLLVSEVERNAAEPGYWAVDHFYALDSKAVDQVLVPAVRELWDMCLQFAGKAVRDEEILISLGIPEQAWSAISESWARHDPAPLARFDLSFNGKTPPKLHECNIDVVGLLYETTFFQRAWLEQQKNRDTAFSDSSQFIRIEDGFVSAVRPLVRQGPVRLVSVNADPYEKLWVLSVARILEERGIACELEGSASISGIHASTGDQDVCGREQLAIKAFRWNLILHHTDTIRRLNSGGVRVISPVWSLVLSSKGCLPWLWRMNPGHPNLLETHFEASRLDRSSGIVAKPLFSIQGQNISIEDRQAPGRNITTPGESLDTKRVYQELFYLPRFASDDENLWVSTGAWVANGEPAGVSITEGGSPVITDGSMRYVPHILR